MMGRFLLLIILCVALAVLRAVIVAAVALAVLALIVSFITRPKQTFVFLGTLSLSALTVAHPLACILTLGLVGVVIAIARRKPNPLPQHLTAVND
ncbi:hypothetical protein [Brevundimonas sp.]|uniref:hypothetical protein n=1 Tax=Brevundimonas sp. TaxID=1871086 RepID=UPI0028985683|nr:hypothetical protein [Brevundimonas sp.]